MKRYYREAPKVYTHILKRQFAYELRPYVCLFIGGIGLARFHQSTFSLLSGLVLIACGALLIYWRANHRG
jgi:hypothetical protein